MIVEEKDDSADGGGLDEKNNNPNVLGVLWSMLSSHEYYRQSVFPFLPSLFWQMVFRNSSQTSGRMHRSTMADAVAVVLAGAPADEGG